MEQKELAALAVALNRPVKSLRALDQLRPEELSRLTAAVTRVCERQRTAVSRTLPQPWRWIVLKLSGGELA